MTYSTSLSAGKSRFSSRGQNVARFSAGNSDRRLGPISNAVILITIICLIGLVYLTQVTKTNAYSYDIQQLQTQQGELKDSQKDLELTAARLQSIDSQSVAEATASLTPASPVGTVQ